MVKWTLLLSIKGQNFAEDKLVIRKLEILMQVLNNGT
jgi:hypothetical protein